VQAEEGVSYRELGARLGITESHARVTAHRFRRHLRAVLREEIMKTVAGPEEVEDEVACFYRILAT
jgi:hypothetical protein